MSKMLRLELVGLTLLACTQILTEHQDVRETLSRYNYYPRHQEPERVTREVKVKQGLLRGSVVRPRTNHNFQLVDVYLGVPYAEPPVRSFRFAPPRSPEPWRGIRQSLEFAPVCPQVLPNLRNEVKPGRYEYLERHLPYLKNQSEDCLYLNIYAPHQPEGQKFVKKYPVMFFIHGESYEWNSGNPYDGTILASYGNVVFVTFNFRLGILGFLRPGTRDDTASNFGLLDQIAALLWLRENIAEFGGDPDSVTLVGHGTGAIFANLLLISPVANSKGLFKRAILMSGSAMSSNAIGKAPLQITKQVAHALNCPTTTDSDLSQCLRLQKLDALLNVTIHKPKYVPAFAPLVDNAVIPDKPFNLMQNTQMFGSFDLMYGVTESEKFHLLSPLALLHGMSDSQRDEILRDHAKATHELEPDLILSKVLEQYGEFSSRFSNEYATKNRDMVLEALSDSGTVAPLITTADLHSRANPKSYMYVFTHPKAMQDYSGQQRQRTIHGEELPYVLGVPFDRREYDLRYNIGEILFSEAMMNWWCSFAYSGNPNVAKRFPYLTDGFKEWGQYDVDWPEYDRQNQTYFNLTIPPNVNSHYRSAEMQFWNEDLPNMLRHTDKDIPLPSRPKGPRPEILDIADGIGKYANGSSNKNYEIYRAGFTTRSPSSVTRGNINDDSLFSIFPTTYRGTSIAAPTPEPSHTKNSHVITMLIGFGIVFLLINLTAFLYMYYKRHAIRKKDKAPKRRASQKEESSKRPKMDKQDNHYGELGYKSDSKPDLNDVIKSDKAYDNNSNFGRKSKLSRQNSSSTIDTHVKVREWIQQEIVHRCSPRFLRKTRETLAKEHQEKLTKQQEEEEYKLEQEILKEKQEEPIYDESPTIVVRPGKKSKLPKVSVAIDATPATRTDSILNQVPIELTKQEPSNEQFERAFDYRDFNLYQTSPQVVVIEHHHSRSDPLPMESVQKSAKPNYSTPRIYEYDSGSASSLYAKINPKLKSRLPRLGTNHEDFVTDEATSGTEDRPALEDTYAKTGSKLTTFGAVNPPCDVNVTCREPTVERECVSPEEALRTIKRRNYPKVLPDIEKRRSLPVPTSLFIPKNQANSLRGYGKPAYQISPTGQQQQPPVPPPRIFGASKSLDFAEENENQCEEEPITTNLHVGPLTKRQEPSTRNNSDPSMLDSLEAGMTTNVQSGGSVDAIYTNPKCPVHGTAHAFSSNSQSMDKDIGKPCAHLQTTIGNPNWYKAAPTENKTQPLMWLARSEPRIVITPREPEKQQLLSASGGIAANWDKPVEAKIVIAPRIGNLSDRIGPRNPSSPLRSNETIDRDEVEMMARIDQAMAELPIVDSLEQNLPSSEAEAGILASNGSINTEKKDGRATMASRDQRGCTGSLKQPKIIIKPTTSFHKSRDQRNIPKVSAIPSPERQNCQTVERERPTALEQKESSRYNTGERPPLREKPKVTRIPSFSTTKRKEDSGLVIEKSTTTTSTSVTSSTSSSTTTATATSTSSNSSYAEKTEIVQRVEAVIPTKISPHTAETAAKSGIPTLLRRDQEKSSSAESFATSNSNSNNSGSTGTVKRKPSGKK